MPSRRVCGVHGSLVVVQQCVRLVPCVCRCHDSFTLVHGCMCLVRCVCVVHGSFALLDWCMRLVHCVCGVHLLARFVVPFCAPCASQALRARSGCCACFPGLRHSVAVVASHMVLCCGYCRRPASLACIVAHIRALCLTGRVTLGAPVNFPVAVGPSPTGCFCPAVLLCGCPGHVKAGRETGSWFPPLPPAALGRSVGLAPCHPALGPHYGVLHGKSPSRWSWVACIAVAGCVWTRPVTHAFSCSGRPSGGLAAGAPALCGVEANTSPCASENTTSWFYMCVCLARGIFPLAVLVTFCLFLARFGLGLPCFSCRLPPPLCPTFPSSWPLVRWALVPCGWASFSSLFSAPPSAQAFLGFRPWVP